MHTCVQSRVFVVPCQRDNISRRTDVQWSANSSGLGLVTPRYAAEKCVRTEFGLAYEMLERMHTPPP